jgi:hypothetical protein
MIAEVSLSDAASTLVLGASRFFVVILPGITLQIGLVGRDHFLFPFKTYAGHVRDMK